jgi:septum formation protein
MSWPFISREDPLILASSSPRRKSLLRQIQLPFRPVPSRVTEDAIVQGDPATRSQLLAEAKAKEVRTRTERSWILGADTMVVIEELVLGKPRDGDDAAHMLRQLSGSEHRVFTGFSLVDPSGRTAHSEAVITWVRVKALTEGEIGAYVATGEPFGKAGGYAIQGIGSFMVETIRGSYSNVVGLPLCALIKALIGTKALEKFPFPA